MSARLAKIRADAHEWRARIDDGQLSHADRRNFELWIAADPLHAAAYAEAEIVWSGLGAVAYDAALARPPAGEAAAGGGGFRLFGMPVWAPVGALAACLAAAVFLTPFLLTGFGGPSPVAEAPVMERYETERGALSTVALADGSSVTIGAFSVLEVAIAETARQARLVRGSAFFEVAPDPDAPFSVAIGAAKVIVTGTAFDLQRRADAVDIAVSEGDVRVTHALAIGRRDPATPWGAAPRGAITQMVDLSAGERVTASRAEGLGEKAPIETDALGAWRRGHLVYLDAPLGDVVADLNRYSATPLKIDGAASRLRLSGTFPADDVAGLLSLLETALPVRVRDTGDGQIIEAKD
ncbi:MAG: FecR domain-containing protein [Pseudomonadota bacterium]